MTMDAHHQVRNAAEASIAHDMAAMVSPFQPQNKLEHSRQGWLELRVVGCSSSRVVLDAATAARGSDFNCVPGTTHRPTAYVPIVPCTGNNQFTFKLQWGCRVDMASSL